MRGVAAAAAAAVQEAKLSEMSGPKFMKREEFNAYAATIRTKAQIFKQLKQELSDLRQETVIIARTESVRSASCAWTHCARNGASLGECMRAGRPCPHLPPTGMQIIKSRAGDLDEFLRKLEEKKGVSGYTAVASEMEKVSALKQRIDESKGKTLNEISRIVDDINAVRGARTAMRAACSGRRARECAHTKCTFACDVRP